MCGDYCCRCHFSRNHFSLRHSRCHFSERHFSRYHFSKGHLARGCTSPLASLSGRARIQRSCLAPMRPAGSGAGGCNPADPVAGAGGCVEADHVQRLVLLARADSSTKA